MVSIIERIDQMTAFLDYMNNLQSFNKDALRVLRAEGLTSPDLLLEVATSATDLRSALLPYCAALGVEITLVDCVHILKAARECHKIEGDSQKEEKLKAALELAKKDPVRGIPLLEGMEVSRVVGSAQEINISLTLGYIAAGSPNVSMWKDMAVRGLLEFMPKPRARRSPSTLEDLQEGRDRDTMIPWGVLDEDHLSKARLIFRYRLAGGMPEQAVFEDVRDEGQLYRRALARWNSMDAEVQKEIENEMFATCEPKSRSGGGTGGKIGGNPLEELNKLLLSLFSEDEMKRFIFYHFAWVTPKLPGAGASPAMLVFTFIEEIVRNNAVDELFPLLREARPRRDADIVRVSRLFSK